MKKKYGEVFVDGSCKGNPGNSTIGIILYDHYGNVMDVHGESIGFGTSPQAEYEALKQGLMLAKKHGVTHLTANTDSEVLANHVNNPRWHGNTILLNKMDVIRNLLNDFEVVNVKHINREKNREADRIAKMSYQQVIDSLGF